jgi:glutathione S-transferase
VTHELVDVPFGAHREEPHLSRQPFAKVPAFEHDGFALYETQAIMRYVDEGIVRVTSWPSRPMGRSLRGCLPCPIAAIAFRRSSSNMPSGCICASP